MRSLRTASPPWFLTFIFSFPISTELRVRSSITDGWTAAPLESTFHFLTGPVPQRRLNPPASMVAQKPNPKPWPPLLPSKDPPGPTTTVLLPAADWNVAVDDLRPGSSNSFVPPLHILLDALIESLIDSSPGTVLHRHLATQLSYLYGHCRLLKTQDFAANLRLDHRQFHYDALSKTGLGTVPFHAEQHKIRDEVRRRDRQPQRNSWYLPPQGR